MGKRSRLEAAILGLLVVAVFGVVLPDLYVTADDGMFSQLLSGLDGVAPSLGGKLWAIYFEAAAMGHFTPTQHAFPAIAFHLVGFPDWVGLVIAVYLTMHAASAFFLAVLLRRLGAPRHAAFAAAALFAVHPVFEEPLACVLFANNVPGVFFLLAACLAWCRRDGEPPGIGGAASAAALLFLCLGCNPNFLVAGPLVLLGVLVAANLRRRAWRSWLPAALSLVVTVGVTVGHRLAVYGTLRTKQPGYTALEPARDLGRFAREVFASLVALRPSRTAAINSGHRNPSDMPSLDFGVAPGSAEFWLVCSLAAGLALTIAWLGRSTASRGESSSPRFGPPLLFSATLAGANLAPYFLFLDHIDLHRYLYAAVAGVCGLAAIGSAWLVQGLAGGRGGLPAAILAAASWPVLAALLATDREAVKTTLHGHRTARAMIGRLRADLADEPEVTAVYVLGYPRVFGRAGWVYPYQWALRRTLAAELGRRLHDDNASLYGDLHSGRLGNPPAPTAAVFRVSSDGVGVQRIEPAADLSLDGPLGPAIWDDHFSALRTAWHELRATTATPDPGVAARLLGSFAARPGGSYEQLVIEALRQLEMERDGARDSRFVGWAPVAVRARALRYVADFPAAAPLAEAALRAAPDSPELAEAALQVAARHERQLTELAVAVAVESPGAESAALALIAAARPALPLDGLRTAIAQERRGRQAGVRGDYGDARQLLGGAAAAYGKLGLGGRSPVAASLLRIQLATGEPRSALAHPLAPSLRLAEEAGLMAGGPGAEPRHLAVEARLQAPARTAAPATGADLVVWIENRGPAHLPGGESPRAASIRWRWFGAESNAPLGEGRRWLPDAGIAPGRWRALPCFVALPAGAHDIAVSLELGAAGTLIVPTRVRIGAAAY